MTTLSKNKKYLCKSTEEPADIREKLLDQLHELNKMQAALLSPGKMKDKLKMITDSVVEIFKADFCRIWVIKKGDLCNSGCIYRKGAGESDPGCSGERCLHLISSSGRYTHIDGEHSRMSLGSYKVGALGAGKYLKIVTNDAVNDLNIHNHEWAAELGLVSFAGYQLRDNETTPFGVLALFSKHPVSDEEDTLLEGLSNTTGQVIHNLLSEEEKLSLSQQLVHSQKMEAVGTLAAGIAHEMNTPIQFIGDNTHFVKDVFSDIEQLIRDYRTLRASVDGEGEAKRLADELLETEKSLELDDLMTEISGATTHILDGVKRVSHIVKAMKAFSHPDMDEMCNADLNRSIMDTLTISKNEYKYVADVKTDLDPALPLIPCYLNELNQVFLNIIVNAAHAIADAAADDPEKRGLITVTTGLEGERVVIRISDTGSGIPAGITHRIFEPFFTTKEVGKGTGQGLSIVHSVITRKHGGTITFKTAEGKGTTFIIGLPLENKITGDNNG